MPATCPDATALCQPCRRSPCDKGEGGPSPRKGLSGRLSIAPCSLSSRRACRWASASVSPMPRLLCSPSCTATKDSTKPSLTSSCPRRALTVRHCLPQRSQGQRALRRCQPPSVHCMTDPASRRYLSAQLPRTALHNTASETRPAPASSVLSDESTDEFATWCAGDSGLFRCYSSCSDQTVGPSFRQELAQEVSPYADKTGAAVCWLHCTVWCHCGCMCFALGSAACSYNKGCLSTQYVCKHEQAFQ